MTDGSYQLRLRPQIQNPVTGVTMRSISGLLWLLLLLFAPVISHATRVPMTSIYDAGIRVSIDYDERSLPNVDYDSNSALPGNEKEMRAGGDRLLFANFAELVAPKSGPRWTAQDFVREVATRAQWRIGGTGAVAGTKKLRALTTMAARDVDLIGNAAFTGNQQRALLTHPNLRSAFRGSAIDARVRRTVGRDPLLRHLEGLSKRGPDFQDPLTPGVWWDMTTPRQWPSHVNKYRTRGNGVLVPTL